MHPHYGRDGVEAVTVVADDFAAVMLSRPLQKPERRSQNVFLCRIGRGDFRDRVVAEIERRRRDMNSTAWPVALCAATGTDWETFLRKEEEIDKAQDGTDSSTKRDAAVIEYYKHVETLEGTELGRLLFSAIKEPFSGTAGDLRDMLPGHYNRTHHGIASELNVLAPHLSVVFGMKKTRNGNGVTVYTLTPPNNPIPKTEGGQE